jgi:hypothetical protein
LFGGLRQLACDCVCAHLRCVMQTPLTLRFGGAHPSFVDRLSPSPHAVSRSRGSGEAACPRGRRQRDRFAASNRARAGRACSAGTLGPTWKGLIWRAEYGSSCLVHTEGAHACVWQLWTRGDPPHDEPGPSPRGLTAPPRTPRGGSLTGTDGCHHVYGSTGALA